MKTNILRHFAGLQLDRNPRRTTILNFRRLLERPRIVPPPLFEVREPLPGVNMGLIAPPKGP